MKTYKVIIKVSTPVDSKKFEMLIVAQSDGHAEKIANQEFPKHEPQMTPDNECNFYVDSVEEFSETSGIVLSCQRI